MRPHRLKPSRGLCPSDFPGKNTGKGCHFLLQGTFRLRDWTSGSCIAGRLFTDWATSEAHLSKQKVKVKSLSLVRLFVTTWTIAHQAPPAMGFSRQQYWSGLPFPSPRDLPDPGIEPGSPTLQVDTLPSEPPGIYFLNRFTQIQSIFWNVYWGSSTVLEKMNFMAQSVTFPQLSHKEW